MTNWFYDQPGVGKRRNKYILPSTGPSDSGGSPGLRSLRIISLPDVFEKIGYEWTKMKEGFVYPRKLAQYFNVVLF